MKDTEKTPTFKAEEEIKKEESPKFRGLEMIPTKKLPHPKISAQAIGMSPIISFRPLNKVASYNQSGPFLGVGGGN